MHAFSQTPQLEGHNDRVLVVDDDQHVLRAVERGLGSAGFTPSCYVDPVRALDDLQALSPLVVVSDYLMPQMNGVAFLKMARAMAPGATRILCTAVNDVHVVVDAVNSGEVFRIVPKPWRPQDLVLAVVEAAEQARRQAANQSAVSRLRETNQRLEDLITRRTHALLQSLVAALNYRDVETHLHSLRVALFARRLAEQLGIRGADLETIEQGALLHDIGKIGVRDHVLLKPGSLTPEEREEMRRHAELGWALLQRVDHLRPASLLVLQHHERWDGAGYPRGLRGEEIIIGARLFHVVDSFDAMTSPRLYRRTKSFEEARQEILACRGAQFDPAVVDAFDSVDLAEWARFREESTLCGTPGDPASGVDATPGRKRTVDA